MGYNGKYKKVMTGRVAVSTAHREPRKVESGGVCGREDGP
jgi:hypothetical protein